VTALIVAFRTCEIALPDGGERAGQLLDLIGRGRAHGQAKQCGGVGEDTDDVDAPLGLLVPPFHSSWTL
jgi:hypothetical protein